MSVLNYGQDRVLGDVTGIAGGSPNTGEMRRKYNFSEKFTELMIDQTPFFRLVSKIGKKSTDDPQFKFTEKRQSWMKRYGYCIMTSGVAAPDVDTTALNDGVAIDGHMDITDTILYMAADYLSQGNIQNIIGQDGADIGDAGTRPEFYLPNQVIKVNYSATSGGAFKDYALYKVTDVAKGYVANAVDDGTAGGASDTASVAGGWLETATLASGYTQANFYEAVQLKCVIVKAPIADNSHLTPFAGDVLVVDVTPNAGYTNSIAEHLEIKRSYVMGTAYGEGSTLMEANWSDQPYSTGYGLTQIFRTEFGMSNTARATSLRYEQDEWARLWRDKLIEHKWEIEQTALFGSQKTVSSVNYTQGAVDYVLSNSNLFTWDAAKNQDDFLNDISQLVDPRYNNSKRMMFFCNTEVYNWLHKIGAAAGYLGANLTIADSSTTGSGWDFAVKGGKKAFGVDFSTIFTPYGDINMSRCIALDNSGVKILGCNMDYVKWRPLVGNGVNRDTSIYVGVQTLENTGTDKRVDMILTEGGFEWSMTECHALWK